LQLAKGERVMLQNTKTHRSQGTEMGVGAHPDEILSHIDHAKGKYGQNHLAYGEAEEQFIDGMPVATGVAVGYALVAETPKDLKRTNSDTILVCPRMSPFYSIAFQTIRGIISEQGGICSTAATAAREQSLPAVTGVRSARQIISDGDLIRIDGTNGSVQIEKKALAKTI
jgi:phosphohistidine swiveling domain-containing protein